MARRRPRLRSACRVEPWREQHERRIAGAHVFASTRSGSAGRPPPSPWHGTCRAYSGGTGLQGRVCWSALSGAGFLRARPAPVTGRTSGGTSAVRRRATSPARRRPGGGDAAKLIVQARATPPSRGAGRRGGSLDPPLSMSDCHSRTPQSASEVPPHGWAIWLNGGLSCPCRLDKPADGAKVEGAIGAASRTPADRRGGWGTAGRLATRPRSRYASLLNFTGGRCSRPSLPLHPQVPHDVVAPRAAALRRVGTRSPLMPGAGPGSSRTGA